jgi:hypothetical protein
MGNAARSGRPTKRRHPIAGEHLRQALRILGKAWRKNTGDPDHVLNWNAWLTLGLPRSATTIDGDIRLGIPEERLAAYAQCLGLSPRMLESPDTDIQAVLGASRQAQAAAPPLPGLGFESSFECDYRNYNSPQYIQALFDLVSGVYQVHYILPLAEAVHRCAFWCYAAERHGILGRGLFVMFGLDNFFRSRTFRWHNNLHSTYLCDNKKELGHFLLVDPLRHNLLARRDPFWLHGQGLTDSGLVDNAPVPFTFRMVKIPMPADDSPGALWDRECEALRRKPSIAPDDAAYAALRQAILAPEPFANTAPPVD